MKLTCVLRPARAGTSVRVDALGGLADDLSLLAAALRFMDFPGNPPPGMPHPALKASTIQIM